MRPIAVAALCAALLSGQTRPSPQELLKKAVALHQAGKLDEAIQNYELLLKMYPDQFQIRSNLGAALAGAGRYSEAIQQYQKSIAAKPDPKVRLNLALAYYKTAQLAPAIQELQKVHQALPENLQATMLLADCYLQTGDNKKVIELLTPLREKNHADNGIAYMLGTALIRDHQATQGQVVIDQILRKGDSAEAHLLMGTTKMVVNDFSGALGDLKRAIELNPKLPDAYAYYGSALMATGDQASSKDAFLKELQQNLNHFDANLKLAILLRQDRDYEEAMKHLRTALLVRPGEINTRFQIAMVAFGQGKLVEPQKELERIVREAPDFIEAHVTLATIYYRQKRKADGDRERQIVAKLNAERQAKEPGVQANQTAAPAPADRAPQKTDTAESRFREGRQLFAAGNYPAAAKQLASAIELNPKLPSLQSLYGQALLFTGDPDGAAAAFQIGLALDANDLESNLRMGEILVQRKRSADALPYLEKAVMLRPKSSEARMALGEGQQASGRLAEARTTLEAAVQLGPDSARAHKILMNVYRELNLEQKAAQERAIVARLQANQSSNDATAGPALQELAPDFTLRELGSAKPVSLHDFRGRSPVVLVFGSYTCPNFRSAARALDDLYGTYGQRVRFLLVYIREAHADDNWQSTRNQREGISLSPAKTFEERQQHATLCVRKLKMKFPALVDDMNGETERAYAAWPSRVFVIDQDGRVAYRSHLTELDFHANELEAVLKQVIADEKDSRKNTRTGAIQNSR